MVVVVAVVLLVVEANRDCVWNVELLDGSCSNQQSALTAATKDCQSKKKRAEFQHMRRDHPKRIPQLKAGAT